MKQSSRIISIPKPCHQDWDAMTPAQQGRHCGACQKVVVDFTLMADGQVLDVLKQIGNQPLCGHFTAEQVDREMVDTRYHPSFIKKISLRTAAMLLLLQSATSAVFAQQAKKKAGPQQQTDKSRPTNNKWPIKGRVLDSVTHMPVAGVGIQLNGTAMDTLTDKDGAFTFMLSAMPTEAMVLEKHIDGHNKVAVIPKTISIADIREGREIVMYGRLDDTTEDIVVTTYKKPLIDKYSSHSPILTAAEIKRAPTTVTGEFVSLPPVVYKRQRGGAIDTVSQNTRIQGSRDNSYPYIADGVTVSKPTFWQRITKPFRKKHTANETR